MMRYDLPSYTMPYIMFKPARRLLLILCMIVFGHAHAAGQATTDPMNFDDRPLIDPITLPDWFKLSFLDLKDSLADAKQAGKRGVIV